MRQAERISLFLILAFIGWAIVMLLATDLQFEPMGSQRILHVELGSDALSLTAAVAGKDQHDAAAMAHNVEIVKRNTYMDFLFIVLYWCTVMSLSYLAGKLGKRFLATCAGICITLAAVSDGWENRAILLAMNVKPFTDQVAVDISTFSQWKWLFFFLAALFLGLAVAVNQHVSQMRRASGWVFIISGLFGLVGISRYRVSLDFAVGMIGAGTLLFSIALLITLWKLYHSLKDLNHLHSIEHEPVHA
jgi:hypothetical protein